mgnify:CR=1 FL=1
MKIADNLGVTRADRASDEWPYEARLTGTSLLGIGASPEEAYADLVRQITRLVEFKDVVEAALRDTRQ